MVNKALCWMVQEGLEIEAEESGKDKRCIDDKTLLRLVEISPRELGKMLQEEFARCFERKNDQTT